MELKKIVYLSRLALVLVATLCFTAIGQAATLTVIPGDGWNEGFNDSRPPDPASRAGGNPGSTLGEQRQRAFEQAASIWAAALSSPVEIRIDASMDELYCSRTQAIIGAAGPQTVHRDFQRAPKPATWYPQALANSLAGFDLWPDYNDVAAIFNSAIGTTCPAPFTWYYGFDGRPPARAIDFVTVVLHELTHGLGYLTFVDLASGDKLRGYDDVFMQYLEDRSNGLRYPQMTNAQRVAASVNTGNLSWVGGNVVADAGEFLRSGRHPSGPVEMYAPYPQEPGSSVSHFSDNLWPDELMEPAYTGVNHAPGLAVPLFKDIGWRLNPVPLIRGNGAGYPIAVARHEPLTLTVSLEPGVQEGQYADWWVAATTPAGLYWFTLDSGWLRSDEPISVGSGPLLRLASYTIFEGVLNPGQYTVYFGIDTLSNGGLDLDALYFESLSFSVY